MLFSSCSRWRKSEGYGDRSLESCPFSPMYTSSSFSALSISGGSCRGRLVGGAPTVLEVGIAAPTVLEGGIEDGGGGAGDGWDWEWPPHEYFSSGSCCVSPEIFTHLLLTLKLPSAIDFWFLNLSCEFLKKLQSSEPLHSKMNPSSCLFGSRFVWAQTAIFPAEPCSKNAGKSTIILWITARE